jgi:predicted nucleotidyltransferase
MSHINIVRIKAVYNALGPLQDKVVFVGGATVSLYPDRRQFEVRPTDDVDVIIEILNYVDRAELEEQLRAIGFKQDIESKIICRYKVQGIIVDIMPTNDASIGFRNIWYPEGFRQSVYHTIDERTTIRILSPAYFIATKLEAFKGRGKGDGRTSHDFEDIVFVLENRKIIWEELAACDEELKSYLRATFKKILDNPNVFEWIDCHVERGSPPLSYYIVEQLKSFCK